MLIGSFFTVIGGSVGTTASTTASVFARSSGGRTVSLSRTTRLESTIQSKETTVYSI